MIQLNPPIPCYIPSLKIEGWIHFIIDYGVESNIYFLILTDNGDFVTLDNTKVKGQYNRTLNRFPDEKIPNPFSTSSVNESFKRTMSNSESDS